MFNFKKKFEPKRHQEGSSAHSLFSKNILFRASHDPLTALQNRYGMDDHFAMAIKRAKRDRKSLAAMFIDLDDFKRINDDYGHLFGDTVLKEVADRLSKAVRETDILARFGGDEFVVITEINSPEEIDILAQRILSKLRASPFARGRCRLTASIGVAVYPYHGLTQKRLLINADKAMYTVKEQGKNNYLILNFPQYYEQAQQYRNNDRQQNREAERVFARPSSRSNSYGRA